jgi:hypothetical protein
VKPFAHLYLFAYASSVKLFCGSVAILAFRYWVKEARWIAPLLPACGRIVRAGPLLALGFLPLIPLAPLLYPEPARSAAFAARGLFYWACWLFLARAARLERPWSAGPGLVLLVLTVTFASVDWLLALTPRFGSTAFGLEFFLSAVLAAFALAAWKAAPVSAEPERQDQGSVHLALLCTWTYVAFMQFLVAWAGNLPREARFYTERTSHGWAFAPAAVALLQFAVPFPLLLLRDRKRCLAVSRALAALTLSQQLLYTAWEILPAGTGVAVGVLATLAAAAVAVMAPERRLHA